MDSSRLLDSLANTLFSQVRLFGLLNSDGARTDDEMSAFAKNRLLPLGYLWELATHAGVAMTLPEELPFLYNTQEWPEDLPPGGWVRATPCLSPHNALQSHISFWFLQDMDTGAATDRLLRGALWILHEQGYSRALQFVLDALSSGLIIEPVIAGRVLFQLLSARRQAASDDEILTHLVRHLPESASQWRSLTATWSADRGRVRPDLSDDLDWLQAHAEREIASCRASQNADEWLTRWAQLRPLMRALLGLFQLLGIEDDLAYGTFAAQIDEIAADGGGQFMVYRLTSSVASDDRLVTSWAMAGAIAAMAQSHGGDWLAQMMEERILLPDALRELGAAHPRNLKDFVPEHWRLALPPIRAIMSEVLLKDTHYVVRPTRGGLDLLTIDAVAGALEARLQTLDSELLALVHSVMRRALAEKEDRGWDLQPDRAYICNVAVLPHAADRLAAAVGTTVDGLTNWIGDTYGVLWALELPALLGDATTNGRDNSIEHLLHMFPNFPYAYVEQAIALDQADDPIAAWDMIATAIALRPGEGAFWHSAGVILRHLDQGSQAAVAAIMAQSFGPRNAPA